MLKIRVAPRPENSKPGKMLEALRGRRPVCAVSMTGTASLIEWARRIKRQVNDEFDRVAALLRSVGRKQSEARRAETEAVIGILEDKRAEVMSKQQAGYFFGMPATRRSRATWKRDDDEVSIEDRV